MHQRLKFALAGQAPVGDLRFQHGEERVEQREVDDLAGAATLGHAQRDHRGGGAVEAGIAIRHVHRRQDGLAILEKLRAATKAYIERLREYEAGKSS